MQWLLILKIVVQEVVEVHVDLVVAHLAQLVLQKRLEVVHLLRGHLTARLVLGRELALGRESRLGRGSGPADGGDVGSVRGERMHI